MKKSSLNKIFKSAVALVLISFVFSSCSVTYRQRHPRYHHPRDKVIIRP